MKKLSYVNKKFHYGDMPVTKPFMRMLVRQITKYREEVQRPVSLLRQRRAFEIIAKRQGW